MSEHAVYPDFFARFYDLIYHSMRDATDHNYFMTKILEAKGPVLEVGVGTGRFFMEALSKGADVYGIDLSPSMIDILKEKLPEKDHHRVRVQNVCSLKDHPKFDLIIAPFRVFMHLITMREQFLGLEKIYQALYPSGSFIFDLFVPNLKMLVNGLNEVKDFEGEYEPGRKVSRFVTMKTDLINQVNHIKFRLVWDENGKEKSEIWETKLRYFFRFELEHLLERSDFKKFHIFGDFFENELKPDSKEFVITCTK